MKIAVPVADNRLCMHFGHCEQFILFDVDRENKKILSQSSITPPPHEPGLLPRWLSEKGVSCVLAGGMGARAISLFKEKGVEVITGAPALEPSDVVNKFLDGSLVTGANTCDH
ncbi:MAG TPA: NifB/NifX family molybdenum-iron cluster-binding protein [Spirochaetota bacterium]|nr:NifB/NifX family molybdenum-iron cluster-binding protein [Spirochaetota bacterium]HON15587.1 NifB/NifX family molybdenum-iron cluster-binding protein [Spirochaetota bacterium]HPP94837.1 NifB/NifX family molybdenum-iron cluster-binding protein [Spirochaetota bacterium]HRS62875.1 NifB/NifX family molybdenum-iron cluster-binding protein [Spirochaetota bacterium]